ncbi:tRNA (adenosine(37)-N6)-dimethylallyltransferase MiaA [Nesterenkonia sp. MY13]|uniref:tRNA dimethylallyltransferase n=1 Tax=Nesterenkonia sedimenti TaxID=1463632 RepID=A0A7X8YF51_9MICC|nr:tRNA (adenosine(37)-N6)-dimethylallyltransferase MiaA [Nesterenkonia sedimenti]NLS10957.1 tRNA (adenosine(37)-N6)-dimethylallyltransferase MiaA [Nesterenkonia sedimenti]
MNSAAVQPLIALVGPTASGKTGLSLNLAEALDGEIINADSMQFYRGMDIGTAKVTPAERGETPHHLFDTLEVTEEASVAEYQNTAREVIQDIRARGKTPIMVGGSGLYIRAVTDVIEFPPTDPELREQIQQELEADGAAELRQELREADPESAAVIKDDRRLVRALEVIRLTGRSFTSYMPVRRYEPSIEPVVQLGIRMDRTLLHQRIEERVHQMSETGLLEEVRQLAAAGLREGRTAAQAIGYQQFLRVVDGALSVDQAVEETIIATRKFARRQETWFRADPRIHWLDAPADNLTEQAMEVIRAATG